MASDRPCSASPLSRDDLVIGLARAGVAEVAPEEIVAFEPAAHVFVSRGNRRPWGIHRDTPFGFGVGGELAVITPVALAMAKAVVDAAAARTADSLIGVVRRACSSGLAFLTRGRWPRPRPPAMVPLTEDQLDRLRTVARARAAGLGMPGERAALLADAIVGALVADEQPP